MSDPQVPISGPQEEDLKEHHESLPYLTDHDIAKNIRGKKDLTEADHKWLADYHTRQAGDLQHQQSTSYDGMED